jgi:hypothetical protein
MMSRHDDEEVFELRGQRDELLNASKEFLDRYVTLINSGDCGNWNPETEDVVIAMRAAIAKVEQS